MRLLRDETLEPFMKETIFNFIDVKLDKGLVSIENRQHYCDRGRYLVKVFSDCVKTFYVDDQDMFPRYYFIFDNLVSELEQWLKARNVNIIGIDKRSVAHSDSP